MPSGPPAKGNGPKKFRRSQIREICEQLGHKVDDVLEIRIMHNIVTVRRVSYDRAGKPNMDLFGPVTVESYHYIDEDVEPDVPEPTPDDAGS